MNQPGLFALIFAFLHVKIEFFFWLTVPSSTGQADATRTNFVWAGMSRHTVRAKTPSWGYLVDLKWPFSKFSWLSLWSRFTGISMKHMILWKLEISADSHYAEKFVYPRRDQHNSVVPFVAWDLWYDGFYFC